MSENPYQAPESIGKPSRGIRFWVKALVVSTLFVLGWFAWTVYTVHERTEFREKMRAEGWAELPHFAEIGVAPYDTRIRVSRLRVMLGDYSTYSILPPPAASRADRNRASDLFPEATVIF